MSLSLINKIYQGKTITWKGEFFTITKVTAVNDEQEIFNAIITGLVDNKDYGLTCSYQELWEAAK